MKKVEEINLKLIGRERNIYELAQLYDQNRECVSAYIDLLQEPKTGLSLKFSGEKLVGKSEYKVQDNIAFFENDVTFSEEWKRLNKQFLNYHKSLSVYTLLNSLPGINYLSSRTGLGELKNKRVLDVGGGTGQAYVSFFQYPETIDYYLLDPNVRLLHDHFIRIYPNLTRLKLKHIVAHAEYLPFKDETFDVLLNISAIDHLDDYKKFIEEAFRVLRPGGKILITSHLDIPYPKENVTKTSSKIFSQSIWERIARYLYFRRYAVGDDDHTLHLSDESIIVDQMIKVGFTIEKDEKYKRSFFIVGEKLNS